MAQSTIREKAIETLELEAKSVAQLAERIDDDFEAAVRAILDCKARIVVTGMGKSGHVGRKIAATLASTIIHRIGARIIAMCGRRKSQLGRSADFYIDIGVEREACPLGLAPTSSTTATLAMGDAIAMALMSARDFKKEDYALFHPGGALGRKLLLTVANVMHTGDENPVVSYHTTAKDALFVMTDKGLGAVSVVDAAGKFIGLVTDGIIRRALAKDYTFLDKDVESIMFSTPLTIAPDKMAAAALSVMEKHQPRPVTVLPVVDDAGVPVGIVHLTDLLRQGVV